MASSNRPHAKTPGGHDVEHDEGSSPLTKSVALEVGGKGVRVNAVAPGPIQTAMLDRFTGTEDVKAYLATLNAQKRIGKPDEIAHAIAYIASDEASFVTGHILTVDGGKSAG